MTSRTAKLAPPAVVIVPVSATCAVRAWRVTAGARRMHRACCVVRCMVHAWCMHACNHTVCAWRVRGGCVDGVGGCNFGASRLQVVRPQLGAGV